MYMYYIYRYSVHVYTCTWCSFTSMFAISYSPPLLLLHSHPPPPLPSHTPPPPPPPLPPLLPLL